MQPEVEYLGFKMNKQGVPSLKENIKAMQSVSKLKSISEMKSSQMKLLPNQEEGLTVVYAVKKFHQYVYSRQFTVLTDHKPLLGMLSEDKGIQPMTAARMQKWAILLSAYNYLLQYCPGNKNGNADFMSCFPLTNSNKANHS